MTSERALERLLGIEQSGVLANDTERRSGYAEMTEVVRDYLGARFGVMTGEMTSTELLRAVAGALDDRVTVMVERWLGRADVVKYGNFPASREEAYEVLEGARTVVVSTQPRTNRAPGPESDVAS
jgi:hypothetical protein